MINPIKRFFDFIGNPSHSRTISILALLIIALAIPLTVNIAQKQQELRQRASGECGGVCISQGGCPSGWTTGAGTCPGVGGVCCLNVPTPSQSTAPTSSPAVSTPTSCPNNTGTPPARPGNALWGGSCAGAGLSQYYSDAGSTSGLCYYTQCQRLNSDPNGPFCWFNSGMTASIQCPGSPTPSTTCDASKGFVSACTTADQGKSPVVNGPCNRVCPAGTAKAGQTVPGVSYKQCQSNLCWYDSLYDKTPAKVADGQNPSNGPGWCYGVPGAPDPCTAIPTGISLSCTNPTCANGVSPIHPAASGNWYCPSPNNPLVDSGVTPACPSAPTGGTIIAFSNIVGLDGIGSTGDQKNPNPNPTGASQGSNKSPRTTTRNITVELSDSTGVKAQGTGQITYDSSSGKFTGTATITQSFTTGTYTVKIKSPGYLRRSAGSQTITTNQTNTISAAVSLVAGDIDRDGALTALDYNFFSPGNCLFKPATGVCASADLNDDGVVDQFDYNLFLREISVVQNGD